MKLNRPFSPLRLTGILCILAILVPFGITPTQLPAAPGAATYYVSSSTGNDDNNGLSTGAPFKNISKVNSLNLQPGDRVLFKCGDVWRVDPLILSKSGTNAAPIEFNSYPGGCANQPVLSGAREISGWAVDAGNVYRADLPAGDFPLGINQLFRNGQRLTLGRWPNLDAPDGGYSFVDGHSAGGNQITDNELPAGNWGGAIVHIKNIRWSMLDRQVTGSSSQTLTLNQGLSCLISGWGNCIGWGYFINNSLNTLDQDGEWFYDPNTRRVYLYSTGGSPENIEGSVVQADAGNLTQAGLMLSDGSATAYVIIDNLAIENWFNHGIGTPGGMNNDIYHHITVRNVTIQDVNAAGVNLSSWLERPSDGKKGLRGGHHLVFTNDVINGANSFGVTGYFAESTFEDNTIENIALVKNLGQSGMGCGITSDECTENGDGFRIRLFDAANSGYGNILRYNHFEKIGYNGVDVFGPANRLENNFITQACYTKADCGAVRTFGSDNLSSTAVYNLHLINNIILDIPGNVDGCHPSRAAFGMGLYIDNYSRDVETRGNTVINTTVSGILYQRSTGQIIGNTIYNASSGTEYSAQIDLSGDETRVSMSNNALYGLKSNAWTLYTYSLSNILSSDYNYFFHPYVSKQIAYGPSWKRETFAQWKTLSGQEGHSKTNWFIQPAGETSKATVFYNAIKAPLTIDLGSRQYLDLDQVPVLGSLALDPFTSKILVDNGQAPLVLQSLQPALFDGSKAADFSLTVNGIGFTTGSVVRWNGSDRPTTFVSSTRLTASIYAADVSTIGDFLITVRYPLPAPGGTETTPLTFRVVAALFDIYLPLVRK
jgi:hypothetical protein